MDKRYSIHKTWFFYTDEWYVDTDLIAQSVGVFTNLNEAQLEKKKLDRISLRNIGEGDLTAFYGENNIEIEKKIVEYAWSQEWFDSTESIKYDNDSKFTHKFKVPPPTATDEQLDTILEFINAPFHKIIECKNVKEHTYIKFNSDFWDKKMLKKLKDDSILDSKSPRISGVPNKGLYLTNNDIKGKKTIKFSSTDDALMESVKILLKCIEIPESNFINKTYVEEWSNERAILVAFLENCTTITLKSTPITKENVKEIGAKLKKQKPITHLSIGMDYFEVFFNVYSDTKIEEINGLINLLKIQPFTIYNQISEINGQSVKEYTSELNTF